MKRPPAIGTALGPDYNAPKVQDVLRRAVRVRSSRWAWLFPGRTRAPQDTLDVLYTAMLFGAFRDYVPRPSSVVDFPLRDTAK